MGEQHVERVSTLERRQLLSADARLHMEATAADEARLEARVTRLGLEPKEQRVLGMAHRLRGTANYRPSAESSDQLGIDEWLEREYASHRQAIDSLREMRWQ